MVGASAAPAQSAPAQVQQGTSIWAALPYISAYWFSAITLVLMNASVLHKMKCPATLTAYHQFCCTVFVYAMWCFTPRFFDPNVPRLSARTVTLRVLPIAVLFALTLGIGNRAYLFLSVAFIQMMKAAHPVLTYVISCLVGVEGFRNNKLQATLVVTLGVVLSVSGELHFNLIGFLIQVFGSAAECLRVVLIGILLSKDGLKLDPMTSLSYIAPLAFVVLFLMALVTERPVDYTAWLTQLRDEVGLGFMAANAVLAFSLNIVTVSLISRTDPVVYVVVGVLKDVLTVIISGILFQTPVTRMQVAGYLLALAGVQLYNMVQKNPAEFDKGLYIGLWSKLLASCMSSSASKALLSSDTSEPKPYQSIGEARGPLCFSAAAPAAAALGALKDKDIEAGRVHTDETREAGEAGEAGVSPSGATEESFETRIDAKAEDADVKDVEQ